LSEGIGLALGCYLLKLWALERDAFVVEGLPRLSITLLFKGVGPVLVLRDSLELDYSLQVYCKEAFLYPRSSIVLSGVGLLIGDPA
jgi:hypothetical protein